MPETKERTPADCLARIQRRARTTQAERLRAGRHIAWPLEFNADGHWDPIYPHPDAPMRWAVEAGRCLTFEGTPLFTVNGLHDAAGYRYHPAELDSLTHAIATALNAAKVDGSRVPRRK